MNAPRIPRLPYGVDQQGRRPEAAWPLQAAEAATDVGADDDDGPMPGWGRWAWAGYLLTLAIAAGAIYSRFF